jgi:hypothetical protein
VDSAIFASLAALLSGMTGSVLMGSRRLARDDVSHPTKNQLTKTQTIDTTCDRIPHTNIQLYYAYRLCQTNSVNIKGGFFKIVVLFFGKEYWYREMSSRGKKCHNDIYNVMS